MPREETAGGSLHEGIMEVALEQWTERIRRMQVGFNVSRVTGKRYRTEVPYRQSAEISLNLGGNTDVSFALSIGCSGLSFFKKGGRSVRQITGNKLLVRALKEEGVDTIFGYPGACTIDISDELYKQEDIRIIVPRHEQALVHAADAYARTTGKVGVCLVTSGPGATNLVTGLATANYDSVPLVCSQDRWQGT